MRALGACAGLISCIWLAVLAMLLVRHTRDVRRLRNWAARAPEAAARQRPARQGPQRIRPALVVAGCAVVAGVTVAVWLGRGAGAGQEATAHGAAIDDLRDVPRAMRARVIVAVLNGTGAAGAAAQVSEHLAALGFGQGPIANASARAASSQVAYADADAVPYAKVIARALRVAAVPLPETPSIRAAAGGRAEVVVTVGT